MSIFKESTKQKLRYATKKGELTTEQLWDLPLTDLDQLAVYLQNSYEESGKKSFLVKRTNKDKTLKLMLDVVVDVLNTKVEELEEKKNAVDVKRHNEKIMALIAEKEEESLKDMSKEELMKLIK